MKKQILSICMALALCLTLLPTAAFADEGASSEPTTPTTPTRVCATEGHIDADNDSKCDACNKAIAESGTWTNKSDDTGNVYGTGTWNLSADGTLTVLCDDDTVAEVTSGITTGIYKNGSVQNGSAVTTVTGTTNATITTAKVESADSVKTTVVYEYSEDIKITVTSTVNYSGGGSITIDTTDVAVTVTATKDGYAVGTPTTGASGETIYKVTDSNITEGDNTVANVTAAVTDTAGGKQATIEIEKDSDTTQFTVIATAIGGVSDDDCVVVTTKLQNTSDALIAKTETYVYASDDQADTIDQTTTSTGVEGTSAYQEITIYSTGVLPDTGYDIKERLADVQDWYRCHDSVKKLVIGAGVTAIGVCNFCDCENLTDVVLPEGLKKISGAAFSRCTSLTGIDIPASVTEIGSGAFDGCTSLTAINVTGNPNYEFKDGVLFRKNFEEDPGTGVEMPDGTLTLHTYLCGNTASEYTIPEDVTAIEAGAFSSAAHLTALTLPKSLGEINPSDCGFDSCEKLSNIYVSAGSTTYTSIDGVLFKINTDDSGESGTASTTASTTESSTASQTLTLLFYPRGRTASSYIFPENVTVTTIGECAFQDTTALTSITIPDTVTAIKRAAFTNSGLTEITIPASVTDLGYDPVAPVHYFDGSAFEGTSLLTKFNVAEGNTTYLSIDGVLFKRNTPDTGTTASTTSGGEGGTEPVELTLLRYPGAKAEGLYTIPSQDDSGNAVKVTAIERRSFESSRYLTSVSIPVGVKTIGFRAFNASMNLVSVFLPASVEKIGALAFQGCFVLKDVYYAGSEAAWNALRVTDCDNHWGSSDLDGFKNLGIDPPDGYDSFQAMESVIIDGKGDYFQYGNWTIPLNNDFLLLGMEKDDISFQRFFSPTFHYSSDWTVEITLDPNGGTLAEDTTVSWTVPYNTVSSYTPPASTRSGYSFEGWTDTMRVFDWELGEYLTITRVWNWADPVYADLDLTAAWSKDAATYSVEVSKTIENGTVKVSPRYAERGDTVTITVTPEEGYVLESLTVRDKNGNELELTDKGNGKYTFQMPAGKVSVEAAFAPEKSVNDYFLDVPTDSYYADAVLWAVKRGITGGVGGNLFGPDLSCTRSQLAVFLYRYAQSQGEGFTGAWMFYLPFTDVPEWCYESVAWCYRNGIVQGYGGELFGSEDAITREQMAVILYRFAQATGMDTTQGGISVREYKDFDNISDYAVAAIQWVVNAGVMQGYDGNLMPGQPCTRAQIVTMLYRLLGE